jgi:ATP-dependent DNA helicase RecQ
VRELTCFGALGRWPADSARALLDGLLDSGLAARSHGERPTLSLTPLGRDVAAGRETSEVELPLGAAPSGSRSAPASGASPVDDVETERRVERLRSWRLERARVDGAPAYHILHDSTLLELARLAPGSTVELLGVKGIGPAKAERYGSEILEVIAAH